jgi:hypothetical protein
MTPGGGSLKFNNIITIIEVYAGKCLILPSTILCSMIPALAPYDSVRYLSLAEIMIQYTEPIIISHLSHDIAVKHEG